MKFESSHSDQQGHPSDVPVISYLFLLHAESSDLTAGNRNCFVKALPCLLFQQVADMQPIPLQRHSSIGPGKFVDPQVGLADFDLLSAYSYNAACFQGKEI